MFVAEQSLFEEPRARLGSREGGHRRWCVQLGTVEVRQYGEGGLPCGKQQEEFL